MKVFTKAACLVSFAILLISISFPALAQINKITVTTCDALGIKCRGDDKAADLNLYIESVVDIFLTLLAVIAAAVLIYGGFLYITAAGDEEQAKKAKKLIIYAIVGLLLIGAAALIVNVVIGIFSGPNVPPPPAPPLP